MRATPVPTSETIYAPAGVLAHIQARGRRSAGLPKRRLRRREQRARGLLSSAALAAGIALLSVSPARGLELDGSLSLVPGAGGCLKEALLGEPPDDASCAGAAGGLAGAQAVAVSPDGASVYVAGEAGVVALARNPATGALACADGGASRRCLTSGPALDGADALAVSGNGRFVYVGSAAAASVSAFARGPDGVLTALAGNQGDGYFGCVAGSALAGVAPPRCEAHVDALAGVAALAISPDGRDLYAVSYGLAPGADSLVALQRDPPSGGLRALAGAGGCFQSLPGRDCRALPGLEGANAIAISPDGRFVYVASSVSGAVRAFSRDARTGALTPVYGRGGCIFAGGHAAGDAPCAVIVPQLAGARSLAFSSGGRQLYVAAFDPGAVVVLDRDPVTGRLAPGPSGCLQALASAGCPLALPLLRGAVALAAAPDGGSVYVLGEGANSLVELTRDPTDGALAPSSSTATALAPLNGPAALALSPGGYSVYVVSPFDDGLVAFTGSG